MGYIMHRQLPHMLLLLIIGGANSQPAFGQTASPVTATATTPVAAQESPSTAAVAVEPDDGVSASEAPATNSAAEEAEPPELMRAEEDVAEDKKEPVESDIWTYFSAGILVNSFSTERVGEAEIRNGRVRVLSENKVGVGVGVQAFYPLFSAGTVVLENESNLGKAGEKWTQYSKYGVGPYVGLTLETKDVIDSAGFGLAYYLRRKEGGIRLGVGLVVDPNARYLSDEFVDGELAPERAEGVKAEGIKYREKTAYGFQFMVAFTGGL